MTRGHLLDMTESEREFEYKRLGFFKYARQWSAEQRQFIASVATTAGARGDEPCIECGAARPIMLHVGPGRLCSVCWRRSPGKTVAKVERTVEAMVQSGLDLEESAA